MKKIPKISLWPPDATCVCKHACRHTCMRVLTHTHTHARTVGERERLQVPLAASVVVKSFWGAPSSQFSGAVCVWPPAPSPFLPLEGNKQPPQLGPSQHCQEPCCCFSLCPRAEGFFILGTAEVGDAIFVTLPLFPRANWLHGPPKVQYYVSSFQMGWISGITTTTTTAKGPE